ncbi:MAG: DUF5309 domain-containing protein [Prevotella sp.]|nr:DUF5309 domain-containing protein [Bacteroides sp.]MCM1367154.1 DUF5309 domain-containing protein [Prevotella sp.]
MQQTNLVTGKSGATIVSNGVLTTDMAQKGAPGLLSNAIDSEIVKIRPMATPLDQISRLGHIRKVDSMEVDYYSVDTRPETTITTSIESKGTEDGVTTFTMQIENPGILEQSESFSWKTSKNVFCTGYISEKNDNVFTVMTTSEIPGEYEDIVRMGRAATQLDVQSPQFSVLPKKNTNYCQIFKMQIEQSVIMKMSHKDIGWNFTDQQEAAIYDMRMGMEKQFLFGNKMKIYDPAKGESVLLTEGIWNQAGKDIEIKLDEFDAKALVDMLRKVFTENSGSRRKILIAGSGLISALNKLDAQRVITARDQVTMWGIDFSELCSKFGRLYVIFSDVFDNMNMVNSGIVVDPEYIQKHVFIPFNAETLDLRGSGQRNTEAMVLTEASCLTLRYPEAHARITGV